MSLSRRFFSSATVALTLAFSPLAAQERAEETPVKALSAAKQSLEVELDAELEKLATLRAQIAETKPRLAIQLQQSAVELRKKQREYDIARSTREAVESEFANAESQLKLWRDERTYLDGLLFDFRKNFEAQSTLAGAAARQDLLRTADATGDAGTAARLELLAAAIDDFAGAGGVRVVAGEALGPDGVMHPGQFVEAGPISWFADDAGELSGLIAASRELLPEILPGTADRGEIVALIDGSEGAPRFDPTLGTAVALEAAEDTPLEHLRKGGIWIWPILFLALVALIAALSKWITIMRLREISPAIVEAVVNAIRAGDPEKAKQSVNGMPHPAAELLRTGADHSELPREALEEKVFERYSALLPGLQRGLPFIGIAAATAPLLGLLGTVTGMIHTFQKITVFGTGDAKPLAGGISEALVTTEFGLIVAIPSLIIHALLSRKTAGIRANMEMTSLAFLNGVKPIATTTPEAA